MSILEVSNLRKAYGGTLAVDDLSFSIAPGEIVGLLGPNGAGKTTTINMILGVLEPSSGRIQIDGHNLANDRRGALLRTNFAAVYAPLPGNLTVQQNLRFFAMLYGVDSISRRIDAVVELAKAMLNSPRLLLLDEPTASLDPATARDVREKIRSVATARQVSVLWTSHNMNEVETVCDRVLFLSRGRILLEGNPRTLPQEHGKSTLEELFIAVAREPLSLES
ncbi:MAG: ABC transporter ATP-binding protein [Acidobacteria bacterium]|nr:ABC transporter ATP-binding protein [Acidobacteriota bacterium]